MPRTKLNMSIFSSFYNLNLIEKTHGRYHLSDISLKKLDKHLDMGTIRFPTTLRSGLLEEFHCIEDGVIQSGHTLNSCYAGFVPNNIDELVDYLKSFNLHRIGAHGINGDLLPVHSNIYYLIGSMTKLLSESLVTICVSIWNVHVLELLEYLHPSRKIEGVNFCIMVTDEFKKAVNSNGSFNLYNPTREQIMQQCPDEKYLSLTVNAVELYNSLCRSVQQSSTSIVNIDRMNVRNMNKHLGNAVCTNICTEILPVGNFACTLGSLNVHKFVKNGVFDWKLFESAVSTLVRTLNLTINVTRFSTDHSIEEYNRTVLRPIAIGVTGYANCLIDLGICYEDSEQFAYRMFSTLLCKAAETSMKIAKKWPNIIPTRWSQSEWAAGKLPIDMWSEDELNRVSFMPSLDIERRLARVRRLLKTHPMVNSNLIGHMPTLRRGLTENMCLSLTPLHSLVTEFGTENSRVIYTTRGLPDHLIPKAYETQGKWNPEFGEVF